MSANGLMVRMEFIKVWGTEGAEEKLLIEEIPDKEDNIYLGIVVEIRNDLNKGADHVYHSNDSIQYRPKLLYKNTKGIYFVSSNNRRLYLTDDLVVKIKEDYPELFEDKTWEDNLVDIRRKFQ